METNCVPVQAGCNNSASFIKQYHSYHSITNFNVFQIYRTPHPTQRPSSLSTCVTCLYQNLFLIIGDPFLEIVIFFINFIDNLNCNIKCSIIFFGHTHCHYDHLHVWCYNTCHNKYHCLRCLVLLLQISMFTVLQFRYVPELFFLRTKGQGSQINTSNARVLYNSEYLSLSLSLSLSVCVCVCDSCSEWTANT